MSVSDNSLERGFGLIIAFVLPGFVCLAAVSRYSPTIAGWMSISPASDSHVVGFLYVALGSTGAGLVASAIRWLLIDTFHHRTGLPLPDLDFSLLQPNLEAFLMAVEHNYRHYQFYANTFIASAFFSLADQLTQGRWPTVALGSFAVLELILLVTSRDCLRRYYRRTEQLLRRDETMLISLGER